MQEKKTRRGVMLALASLPVLMAAGRAQANSRGYTARTAPDALTRHVLGDGPLDLAAAGGDLRYGVHRNHARVIEHNFARRTPAQAAALWSRLTEAERRGLALSYAGAAFASGRPPLLFDLLATRLDGKRLGQAAQHFGFEPVYGALMRQAPAKLREFEHNAAPSVGLHKMAYRRVQFRPNLDMTLQEIYHGFRTAGVGGASVAAAIYETVHFVAPKFFGLTGAVTTGVAVGTGISMLLQAYAPGLHDSLGAVVYHTLHGYENLGAINGIGVGIGAVVGGIQRDSAPGFGLSPETSQMLRLGGDFNVTWEWSQLEGMFPPSPPPPGGGCGGPVESGGCPILH